MRIAFVHYPGRVARLEAARAGEAPTEFFLGAVELERAGFDISHFEVDPDLPTGRLGAAVDRAVYQGRLPPHLGGTVLGQTRGLLGALNDHDVVVGSTTGTSLALATWRRLGALRRPVVGIVSGLADRPHGRLRRATTRELLRAMHSVLYGAAEVGPMAALDRRLAGRVHVNQFGVDTSFWTPGGGDGDGYVLAIGNDGRRDYETLVRAAAELDAPVRIFTRLDRPRRLPGNVTWRPADWHRQLLSDDDVRGLYRAAALVVVPLRDSLLPSGQSVTLQAMSCAKPVVLTETRGLWSRSTLRDGRDVLLVPPKDHRALASVVDRLLRQDELRRAIGNEARKRVQSASSSEMFADRLAWICGRAVAYA